MKIAILGTRGIPASYGGFETCVEEIAPRLAARGHDVSVYCRSDNPKEEAVSHRGVSLIHLPKLRTSFVASPFNSLVATVHGAFSSADILHYFGCGNVPFTLLGRLFRKKVVLTLDGIEWKRDSYSTAARMYLRSFAENAMVFPNVTAADSRSAQEWYHKHTGVLPKYIPYGTVRSSGYNESILGRYGLTGEVYVFFAGRLVREKGVHTLIEAFKSVEGDYRLVIVGDFPGRSEYVEELKKIADQRTLFLGYVYGEDFETLRNAARVYVHPSALDGTSISLLGALGAGLCVLSSDLQENIDVAGDAAVYFRLGSPSDLADKLRTLLDDTDIVAEFCRKSRTKATEMQDWDEITDLYEQAYSEALGR